MTTTIPRTPWAGPPPCSAPPPPSSAPLGENRLITPLRSEGGHRRYSRYQLRVAARARELVDQGNPIEAACRIVILEDQLEEAQRINEELRSRSGVPQPENRS